MIASFDQLATRERQAGPYGVTERLVVPMKPGNSDGGTGLVILLVFAEAGDHLFGDTRVDVIRLSFFVFDRLYPARKVGAASPPATLPETPLPQTS